MSNDHAHHEEDLSTVHPAAKPFLWLANPKVERNFIWFPVAGMILMIILGIFFPQKHPAPWDKTFFGFMSWALIGFCAYSFVVLSAEPLFRLLARKESYYGEGSVDFEVPNQDMADRAGDAK